LLINLCLCYLLKFNIRKLFEKFLLWKKARFIPIQLSLVLVFFICYSMGNRIARFNFDTANQSDFTL
jgi:uncharacterized membrane protein